jgi:hypothetical protein
MVLDPEKHDPNSRLINLPDNALKVITARLKAGEFDETVEVRPGEKMVQFRVPLEPGDVNLKTWFTDTAGVERGAYYVYIERVN